MSSQEYIFPSEPRMDKPNMAKAFKAEAALRKAVKENQEKGCLHRGISKEEAETVLQWVVFNARNALDKEAQLHGKDIFSSSLRGACGFGQSLTGFPLESMGLDVRLPNVREAVSPKSRSHAFLVVGIPTKGQEIEETFYLVDTTFKQFCLSENCNDKHYFSQDERFKGECTPDPGFFMNFSEKGKEVAEHIMREGFIELTPENAKTYGDAFRFCERGLNYYERKKEAKDLSTDEFREFSGEEYIERFTSITEEYDCDKEEFNEWGYNIETPYEKMKENFKETVRSGATEFLKASIGKVKGAKDFLHRGKTCEGRDI
ncbi:MAG: hypothetical protein ACM3KR_07750 [Deltaproteobacteria bacterium]